MENLVRSTIKGKRVFLTGHTGFKGSWLLHVLKILGAEIKGYALAAPKLSLFELTNARSLCTHIEGDIRDRDGLKKHILDFEPEIVFHFAAQPLVLDSYHDPVYTFEVNQLGTIYLLDALRYYQKPCIVIVITTDKVYEDKNWCYPYRETDRLGGFDPYSASKAMCELAVSSYRNSFFNLSNYDRHLKSIAAARAGNVIGGGDFSSNRLIPDVVLSLLKGESVTLRNPTAIRPWQHVLDALSGYLVLAAEMCNAPTEQLWQSSWNFGPISGDTYSVETLTKMCIDAFGGGNYKLADYSSGGKETSTLVLDTSKANTLLGWKPKWDTKEAIKQTVGWYTKWNGDEDMSNWMTRQINYFLSL